MFITMHVFLVPIPSRSTGTVSQEAGDGLYTKNQAQRGCHQLCVSLSPHLLTSNPI